MTAVVSERTMTRSAAGWLVTAPHCQRSSSRGVLPFGLFHAKRPGSAMTACGVSALEWHSFWELDFGTTPGRACPRCADVVES